MKAKKLAAVVAMTAAIVGVSAGAASAATPTTTKYVCVGTDTPSGVCVWVPLP